ncbi:MAG: uracil phosphoribosyltransferase [Chloroflexi bacterium]|nr:uracil phosphoribosyltransferase [Chloroflexota bacterium]
MSEIFVSTHPLVLHELSILRDRDTPPPAFRAALHRISLLLLQSATVDLPTRKVIVQTPLESAEGLTLDARVGFAPILRAGLGMVNAALEILPEAEVWHLGFYRDETTLQPVRYYSPLGEQPLPEVMYVLDPMLATGGSAVAAIRELKLHGAQQVKFVGVLAAPEGIARVREAYPDVALYLAAVDRALNEHGYILPGLGDAGDRQFGTA